MTHLEIMDQSDLNRFSELDVDADIQVGEHFKDHSEFIPYI